MRVGVGREGRTWFIELPDNNPHRNHHPLHLFGSGPNFTERKRGWGGGLPQLNWRAARLATLGEQFLVEAEGECFLRE